MKTSVAISPQKPRFDQEFIERRMRQHRAWQEAENERLTAELWFGLICSFERKLAEVKELLRRKAA